MEEQIENSPGTLYVPEVGKDVKLDVGSGPSQEPLQPENKGLVMMLLKQVRIGMDLSRVVLPTFILEPRSMLEKLSDYLTHVELLALVPKIHNPLQRLISLLRWYLSGFYIRPEGVKKPYNPILGEFFRCMWKHNNEGSKTFFVSEQVSHHPPISAFYASNRKEGFVINGSILFKSKFLGTSIASILDGYATVYITPFDEEYELTFPSVHAKGFLFGTLMMELVGHIQVTCKKTGLKAEVEFKGKPFLGGDCNAINGKIHSGNLVLYTLSGKWDLKIDIKNEQTQEIESFWEPTPEIRANKLPKHKPSMNAMDNFESDKLWSKVTDAIKKGDQQTATDEKALLEHAQREHAKKLLESKAEYQPRLFKKDHLGKYVYVQFNKSVWSSDEVEEYEMDNGLIQTSKE